MNYTILLLNQSTLNLTAFVPLLGQNNVNYVDSTVQGESNKIQNLVSKVFSGDLNAFDHLYATFYYKIPIELDYWLREFHDLQWSSALDGISVHGMMSGTFREWKRFIIWSSTEEQDSLVRMFGNEIHRSLGYHDYFAKMKSTEFSDKTLMLE